MRGTCGLALSATGSYPVALPRDPANAVERPLGGLPREPLEECWGPHRGLSGGSGAVSGRSRPPLAPAGAVARVSMGCVGGLPGRFVAIFEDSWAVLAPSSGFLGAVWGALWGTLGLFRAVVGLYWGPVGLSMAFLEADWAVLGRQSEENYVWPYAALHCKLTSRQCFSSFCCPCSPLHPRVNGGPRWLQRSLCVVLLFIFLARASFYAVPFLLAELLPSRLSVDYVLLQRVSLLPFCYLLFRQLLRLFLFLSAFSWVVVGRR